MIVSIAEVVADPNHATERVLAVDLVVDFRHPVVADIAGGGGTGVGGRVRRGPLDEAARAGGWSQGAAQQFQADGTGRHPGALQRIDGIHHAVPRIRGWEPGGCGRGFDIQVADQGTQALIAREKEEFVLLEWAAYHAAELLQLHWQQRLGRGVEDAAGVPGAVAAKRVSRTVKSVGPRSDSHVHHGTGLPTVLGLRIFHEVEFLDGVDRQNRRHIAERTGKIDDGAGVKKTGIDNAVDHPAGFIGTNVVGALGPRSAARLDHDARPQIQQILIVAAIQRHIHDVHVGECAAQRGARGVHQRDRFVDRDGLALLARFYGQVD